MPVCVVLCERFSLNVSSFARIENVPAESVMSEFAYCALFCENSIVSAEIR